MIHIHIFWDSISFCSEVFMGSSGAFKRPPVFRPLDLGVLWSAGVTRFSPALKFGVGPPFAPFITRLPWGRGVEVQRGRRRAASSVCIQAEVPPPRPVPTSWSLPLSPLRRHPHGLVLYFHAVWPPLPPPPTPQSPSTHLTWSPRLATFPTDSTHAQLSFSPLVDFQPGPNWVSIESVCVCVSQGRGGQ